MSDHHYVKWCEAHGGSVVNDVLVNPFAERPVRCDVAHGAWQASRTPCHIVERELGPARELDE